LTSQISQITLSGIVAGHEKLMQLALDKGDLPTATRNQELIGKTLGAYTDKLAVSADKGSIPPDDAIDDAIGSSRKRVESAVL